MDIFDEVGESGPASAYVKNEVGEVAKGGAHKNPLSTVYDAKRMIGKPYSDKNL